MNLSRLLRSFAIVQLLTSHGALAYTPASRWGQAVALINNDLYIHGGLSDPSNSFSYTGAPIIDELLYLSLSDSFELSSTPWTLVSSSSNSSTKPGPALAWHTVSPVNATDILLFGGLPAVSSPTVLVLRQDSAWILNIFNRFSPSWWQGPMNWAEEPLRRIHHTATTTTKGLVIVIGGERADGSRLTFSDHYIFDPNGPSFTELLTTNAPPGITGHAAILLPDGRLLIFGGYNPKSETLVPFSTIWVLDTQSLEWSLLPVKADMLPTPRRAFAAVLIDGGKIVIHGGCDVNCQTAYSDGWILDTSQNPVTWTEVESLAQLGPRRDHFAVPASGDEIMFGFGYGQSGPALATPVIWKPSDGSFPSSHTPQRPPTASPTLPVPTQTGGGNGNGNGNGNGGQPGDPTGTSDPNNPTASVPPNPNAGDDGKKKTTAIAVGTTIGLLALLAGGIVVIYYVRKRRSGYNEAGFLMLDENDLDSPHSPHPYGGAAAVNHGEKAHMGTGDRQRPLRSWNIGGALTAVPVGIVGISTTRRTDRRIDMLADEDTREFGSDWRRRNNSSWSLMSFMRGPRSREPSTSSYANIGTGSPRTEKGDPFSDGAALLRDEETGFIGAAVPPNRPSNKRHFSQASSASDWSYTDPFQDPIPEEMYHDIPDSSLPRRPHPPPVQPPLSIQTVIPSAHEAHTLSPVTEVSRGTTSQSDLASTQSSHSHSNDLTLSPFDSGRTSQTSYNPTRPTSLIDSMSSGKMRRSDSWWSRFSRTAFLDRRGSGSRHGGGLYDIRDPNPPPRLVAIEENQHSGSASGESPGSKQSDSVRRSLSRKGPKPYTAAHGKSMSSIRTADSDALEKMAGMDVVQRERLGTGSGSQKTRDNRSSYGSSYLDDSASLPDVVHGVNISFHMTSPTEMTHEEAARVRPSSPQPISLPPPVATVTSKDSPNPTPSPPHLNTSSSTSLASGSGSPRPVRQPTGKAVAARVQAYERRATEEPTSPVAPGKRRKSVTSYGLAPRPSLFVANPDHRFGPSESSTDS